MRERRPHSGNAALPLGSKVAREYHIFGVLIFPSKSLRLLLQRMIRLVIPIYRVPIRNFPRETRTESGKQISHCLSIPSPIDIYVSQALAFKVSFFHYSLLFFVICFQSCLTFLPAALFLDRGLVFDNSVLVLGHFWTLVVEKL